MIAARIGHDHFLVWRLPLDRAQALVPIGARPVHCNGQAWLLFAIAELKQTRVRGLPVPGRRTVAGWLIPCEAPEGGVGNLFLQAYSDDPLVVIAYRVLGLHRAQHAPLSVDDRDIRAPGVRATLGEKGHAPDLAWFAADRCGLLARGDAVVRLPLAKRGWHWQVRTMTVEAPFAANLGAVPVAAIDCSQDLALWGMPRRRGATRC